MKAYDPSSIRNVAIIGHGHSGKTSLTSALLFTAGTSSRLGSVDDGTSVTDYDEDEIEKKISLQIGLAHVEWANTKINILDTPGYGNFIYEAKAALRVADGALLLIEAVSGVEVQTEKVWGFCEEFNTPRLVAISRMNRDNASAERALKSTRAKFGRGLIPIQVPIGAESEFKGVVDLVEMKAYTYPDDKSGKAVESEVPEELAETVANARRALIEAVAEVDDDLMNKYLETETLDHDEFVTGLLHGVDQGVLVPIVYCSGTDNVGSAQILDAVVKYMPSANTHDATAVNPKDDAEVSRACDPAGPLSAFVFKTLADPYAGKLSLVRVYSGKVSGHDSVYNVKRGEAERTGALYHLQGKTQETVEEITAGDIGAIPKLKETTTNDTLTHKDHQIIFPPTVFPEPAMSFAADPKTRGDEDKMAHALLRIAEEDPTVHYGRDPQTNELLISGMGDRHVEVVVGKLKRKFGVEVVLHTPKVPYRETIKRKVEVQGRHKKQSGGRGQFGDCWIRLEPLPRGAEFEFADEIFGGSIPQNFRPAVEKGIQEARQKGFLAGNPVVDFKVTLYDGSYHTVDSSEIAFKIAGSMAFKKGMEKAGAVLLEPIMDIVIEAPDETMGDLIGQINTRRGRISGMEGGVIKAQAPMAEMLTFAPTLKSLTSGRGDYHMEFSHYDEVPAAVQQKVIEEYNKKHHSHDH